MSVVVGNFCMEVEIVDFGKWCFLFLLILGICREFLRK